MIVWTHISKWVETARARRLYDRLASSYTLLGGSPSTPLLIILPHLFLLQLVLCPLYRRRLFVSRYQHMAPSSTLAQPGQLSFHGLLLAVIVHAQQDLGYQWQRLLTRLVRKASLFDLSLCRPSTLTQCIPVVALRMGWVREVRIQGDRG